MTPERIDYASAPKPDPTSSVPERPSSLLEWEKLLTEGPAKRNPVVEAVFRSAAEATFGRPLLTNVVRATVVEAIVAKALPDWTWCSADYSPYDFVRETPSSGIRVRLEVKQSATFQSWWTSKPSEIRWDVAPRASGRNADIYVLAAHLAKVREMADHREPGEWRFFIVRAKQLDPLAKTIGLVPVGGLAQDVGFDDLAHAVDQACAIVASEVVLDSNIGTMPRCDLAI